MMKRLLSCSASEILALNPSELKQGIRASEGRIICTEMVSGAEPVSGGLSNGEVAKAFGADLLLLNGFDVFDPVIKGVPSIPLKGSDPVEVQVEPNNPVAALRRFVARPIGINLEPVDLTAVGNEPFLEIPKGRICSEETLSQAQKLGVDFICLTGNPGTGVSNQQIAKAVALAKEHFNGLIIAGKMHGAGVAEAVVSLEAITEFIENGADVILLPAVGTIPGWTDQQMIQAVKVAHNLGALTLSAIGTSQESADVATIKQLGIRNKVCGVDIQHIGDAGFGGLAPIENIYGLSVAIRGVRHTVNRMATSIAR